MATVRCIMPPSSPCGSGMLQGLRHAVKDPLAAALRRAAAAERQAAAAEQAVATVTAESVALAQHNHWLVQQLAEATAARAEAEQRLRAAGLELAAGRGGGGAAQQPEGALEQVGGCPLPCTGAAAAGLHAELRVAMCSCARSGASQADIYIIQLLRGVAVPVCSSQGADAL